ncbi:unnamed protein product, partial [Prunus brigantina]
MLQGTETLLLIQSMTSLESPSIKTLHQPLLMAWARPSRRAKHSATLIETCPKFLAPTSLTLPF